MPNRIILKRSSVSAKVPLASDLSAGELAINLADKRLFSKDGAGNVINVTVDAGHITSGSLADPSWLTSLAKAKVGLGNLKTRLFRPGRVPGTSRPLVPSRPALCRWRV